MSTLADSGFVVFVVEIADAGVDLDVAAAGVFLVADDGCCWLTVGLTFVVALAVPIVAAGFLLVPALLGCALSADFAAPWHSVVILLTGAEVGSAACSTGAEGLGAKGSNVSMRSFDALGGAGAAGGGIVSGTVLVANGSKSIRTPPPPPALELLGTAADCDATGGPFSIAALGCSGCVSVQQKAKSTVKVFITRTQLLPR